MSWVDRVRDTVWDAATATAEATKKQARRAQLEMRASRLEARVRREKLAIGEALYPQLVSGEVKSDLAEVQTAMARIEHLDELITENNTHLEGLLVATPGKLPQDED